eukprot:Skav216164  [mRNA]  locus=scaffold1043:10370:11712:+ [translate_table: standard]
MSHIMSFVSKVTLSKRTAHSLAMASASGPMDLLQRRLLALRDALATATPLQRKEVQCVCEVQTGDS